MLDFDKLRGTLNEADSSMKKNIGRLGTMAKDAKRVSNIAKNPSSIITDIDRKFEQATELTGIDVIILFLAVALQVTRQYIFSNDKFRLNNHTDGDKIVKSPLKLLIKNKTWRDILLGSVPYDAVNRVDGFIDSTGISGSTHRYLTLGHDPILGWIFGPINILSDSLTKSNFVETYAIENMLIKCLYPGGTPGAVNDTIKIINESYSSNDIEDKLLLPAAVIKQAIHFGADYFTKQGLPILDFTPRGAHH